MATEPDAVSVTDLLDHYARRFHERVGRPPRSKDLDATLARTFLQICGPARANHVIDMWFDSVDPWYARAGFEFGKSFAAVNRLIGTGQLEPSGTPRRREAIRRFAACLQQPRLRLVALNCLAAIANDAASSTAETASTQ